MAPRHAGQPNPVRYGGRPGQGDPQRASRQRGRAGWRRDRARPALCHPRRHPPRRLVRRRLPPSAHRPNRPRRRADRLREAVAGPGRVSVENPAEPTSCRINALNVHFIADHIRFTPNGRRRRRVIGISAPDPERAWRGIGGITIEVG